MQLQIDPRVRKRIPCSIQLEGQEQKAVVLNVSRGGLFVQTTARARRGDMVSVSFALESSGVPVSLPARVVWTRRRTVRSAPVDGVGLGLQLRGAPQTYLDLCDQALPVLKFADEDAEAIVVLPELFRYRVRLKLDGTARTRWVECEAVSRDEAGEAAVVLATPDVPGEDWEVLEVRSARSG